MNININGGTNYHSSGLSYIFLSSSRSFLPSSDSLFRLRSSDSRRRNTLVMSSCIQAVISIIFHHSRMDRDIKATGHHTITKKPPAPVGGQPGAKTYEANKDRIIDPYCRYLCIKGRGKGQQKSRAYSWPCLSL